MSVAGQTRLSATMTATSALGKKQKFPIFIQNFIHLMSEAGGEADQVFSPADFRFVPRGDRADRRPACPNECISNYSVA
jgi:hypothetical protein